MSESHGGEACPLPLPASLTHCPFAIILKKHKRAHNLFTQLFALPAALLGWECRDQRKASLSALWLHSYELVNKGLEWQRRMEGRGGGEEWGAPDALVIPSPLIQLSLVPNGCV